MKTATEGNQTTSAVTSSHRIFPALSLFPTRWRCWTDQPSSAERFQQVPAGGVKEEPRLPPEHKTALKSVTVSLPLKKRVLSWVMSNLYTKKSGLFIQLSHKRVCLLLYRVSECSPVQQPTPHLACCCHGDVFHYCVFSSIGLGHDWEKTLTHDSFMQTSSSSAFLLFSLLLTTQ